MRSISRPGHAITVSAPFLMSFTCPYCETPPKMQANGNWQYFEYFLTFSAVCAASSRVGERTSARGCPMCRGRRTFQRWFRIGSMNAAVLPVPVCAMPIKSRPSKRYGIARAWIGVGVLYPASATACWSFWSNRPKTEPLNIPLSTSIFSIHLVTDLNCKWISPSPDQEKPTAASSCRRE